VGGPASTTTPGSWGGAGVTGGCADTWAIPARTFFHQRGEQGQNTGGRFPLRELHKLAAHWLDQENPGQTLEATVQVHVASLRLVGAEQSQDWHARGQSLAAAAQVMRKILGDSAQRKRRTEHAGGRHRVDLDDEVPEPPSALGALPALDEALTQLAPNDLDGRPR
jgi:hypothetical protein